MATLRFLFHPAATADLAHLASSANASEKKAAEQIIALLNLAQSNLKIWNRLQSHHDSIWVKDNGVNRQVDIRIIESLKDIAWDPKYHTDAIRRIKDLFEEPLNQYRIFFAPVSSKGGGFNFKVLGIFKREIAYTEPTLNILRTRYGS